MGLAPIVAGVSIFGAVSQYSSQRQQAANQQASIAANKEAAQAEAAIRNANIAAQKNKAQYEYTIGSLQRQLADAQMNAGLQASAIIDNAELRKKQSDIDNARMLTSIQQQSMSAQLDAAKAQNKVGAAQTRSEAQLRASGISDQLQQRLGEAGAQMSEGDRRAAAMRVLTAGGGLAQSATDEATARQQILSGVASALGTSYEAMSVQEQNQLQLAFDTFMANSQEEMTALGLNTQEQSLGIQGRLQNQQLDAAASDIPLLRQILNAGRDTAKAQFGYSSTLDEQTQKTNLLLAEQGLALQGQSVQSALGAQMASLDAQRNAVRAQTPGLLQLLPSLVGSVQPLVGSLLSSGGSQRPQQQQMLRSTTQPLYSGYRVPEYYDTTSPFNMPSFGQYG